LLRFFNSLRQSEVLRWEIGGKIVVFAKDNAETPASYAANRSILLLRISCSSFFVQHRFGRLAKIKTGLERF
jgi:hypothetical protein